MCHDEEFDPENSELICGPINMPRWIYSCSKQLMDRVIGGYGMEQGLNFTLFRRSTGSVRAGFDPYTQGRQLAVLTQFLGISCAARTSGLVDGGIRKRAFTTSTMHRRADENHRNKDGIASGKITTSATVNNYAIRDLADMMLKLAANMRIPRLAKKVKIVETTSARITERHQDVQNACRKSPTPARTR